MSEPFTKRLEKDLTNLIHPNQPQPAAPQPYRCPHCGTHYPPTLFRQLSPWAWLVFFALLLICFPLSFFAFTIKDEYRVCSVCRARLD